MKRILNLIYKTKKAKIPYLETDHTLSSIPAIKVTQETAVIHTIADNPDAQGRCTSTYGNVGDDYDSGLMLKPAFIEFGGEFIQRTTGQQVKYTSEEEERIWRSGMDANRIVNHYSMI